MRPPKNLLLATPVSRLFFRDPVSQERRWIKNLAFVNFPQIPKPVTRVRTPQKSSPGGLGALAVNPKFQRAFRSDQ
jgi:hypothetical protein